MPFLGAHESVSGGLHLAFARLSKVGGQALQIFTRNQRQWNAAPISREEMFTFQKAWQEAGNIEVVSHASYLINLASNKKEQREKSIQALSAEIQRCHLLAIPAVVLHPGSHGGDGIEKGLERIVSALDTCFERGDASFEGVSVLLETTAGQGTGLGSRFEELGAILEGSKFKERLGICFDTCHVFAAGYDFRTQKDYMDTMLAFDTVVGLDRIRFFHLNDSKKELGSRVDRHEHIGKGAIGLDGFRNLLNDPVFAKHSMTLETPKDKDLQEDVDNLLQLQQLLIA